MEKNILEALKNIDKMDKSEKLFSTKKSNSKDEAKNILTSFSNKPIQKVIKNEELEANEELMVDFLLNNEIDISEYPCVHMAYHLNSNYGVDNPNSTDFIFLKTNENKYGIIIHDNKGKMLEIYNCPFCGVVLNEQHDTF